MRFLFTTLQFHESEFYDRVGCELRRRGHEVDHVTFSRRSARAHGARCLADELAAVDGATDWEAEARRIVASYDVATLRDVYKTDGPVDATDEPAAIERTVRHFLARDVDSFSEIRAAVPAVLDREGTLHFLAAAMRACRPGKPVLVDRSDANAREPAASLNAAARGDATSPLVAPAPETARA